MLKNAFLYGFSNLVQPFIGLFGGDVLENQYKLLATIPDKNIVFPDHVFNYPGHANKHNIAEIMSISVIYQLEIIYIEHGNCQQLVFPNVFQNTAKAAEEICSVIKSCEEIGVCHVVDLFIKLGVFDGHAYLVTDNLQKADIFTVEKIVLGMACNNCPYKASILNHRRKGNPGYRFKAGYLLDNYFLRKHLFSFQVI